MAVVSCSPARYLPTYLKHENPCLPIYLVNLTLSNFMSSLKSWEFTASLSSLGHLDYFVTCDKFAHLLPHERLNYYITHDVVFFFV